MDEAKFENKILKQINKYSRSTPKKGLAMTKLIFKADKGTMGNFRYIGFRKYVGKNPAMGTDLYGNYVLINSSEYIELGFIGKPNVANWKDEIDEEEFKRDTKGTLLGCGEFEEIELLLSTHSNLTPVEE